MALETPPTKATKKLRIAWAVTRKNPTKAFRIRPPMSFLV